MVKNYLIVSYALAINFMIFSSTSIAEERKDVKAIDGKAMVEVHNTVRKELGLSELRWSTNLVTHAQQWADHLKKTEGCHLKTRPKSNNTKQEYGENLYWASPLKWSDGHTEVQEVSERKVVDVFTAESGNYDYKSNTCKKGSVCGHYTQVIWKKTEEVGCAKAICDDNSMIWVCNYNPAGNYIGQRPY